MIPTREVKVKLWHKIEKKMYHNVIFIKFHLKLIGVLEDDGRTIRILSYDDTTLINYIGMNDFFGQDIYEGDILQAGDDSTDVVVTLDGMYKWGIHALFGNIVKEKWLKVVSNVFENPKYLKERKV